MSLKFLLNLAGRELPFRTSDQTEIIHVDILNSGQLIVADLPVAKNGAYQGDAIVHSISPAGTALIASLRRTNP
jgi:hypothetical protein